MQHQYSSATAQLGELAGGAGTRNMSAFTVSFFHECQQQ